MDGDGAVGGTQHASQHRQPRGLAAPRRPEDRQDLAGGGVERDLLDGRDLESPFLVNLGQPLRLDGGHARKTTRGSTRSALRTETIEAVTHMITVRTNTA